MYLTRKKSFQISGIWSFFLKVILSILIAELFFRGLQIQCTFHVTMDILWIVLRFMYTRHCTNIHIISLRPFRSQAGLPSVCIRSCNAYIYSFSFNFSSHMPLSFIVVKKLLSYILMDGKFSDGNDDDGALSIRTTISVKSKIFPNENHV